MTCAGHAELHPAYGHHPCICPPTAPPGSDLLADWLARRRPVAVGECGLTSSLPDSTPRAQRAFRRQLGTARDADLPVIVHARRAVDEVIAGPACVGGLRGVVHSYSGGASDGAARDLGFCLGFSGPIT